MDKCSSNHNQMEELQDLNRKIAVATEGFARQILRVSTREQR